MRSLCLDLASAEDHPPLCVDLAEETWEDEEFKSGLSFNSRSSATLCRPYRGDMGGCDNLTLYGGDSQSTIFM